MKILHTSDWHLGQNFFGQSRRAEHQAFLDWLLTLITEHKVDAVIVAGDVFDTGSPPSYAREMYHRFIVATHQLGCTLVVLGGNHDSVAVLNESRPLLACLNTYVVAAASSEDRLESEQLIELKDRTGAIGAILCAVPFIRPRDVLLSRSGQSGAQKQQALGEAIKQHYQRLFEAAERRRDALEKAVQKDSNRLPIIATGHLAALGVAQSESVRDIYIGTLEGFAADGFPAADYIALGHIHRPQKVAGCDHIRYSGSPITLSFDELGSTRQVVLVSFTSASNNAGSIDEIGSSSTPTITHQSTGSQMLDLFADESLVEPVGRTITLVDVPVFQAMTVLRGNLAAIKSQLKAFRSVPDNKPVWLCIEVESEEFLVDLPQRIQSLTDGLAVEVLQLRRARNTTRQVLESLEQETLAELTPEEVFSRRLALESMEGEQQEARLERIQTQFRSILMDVLEQTQSQSEPEQLQQPKQQTRLGD